MIFKGILVTLLAVIAQYAAADSHSFNKGQKVKSAAAWKQWKSNGFFLWSSPCSSLDRFPFM
jgi:hypothetical protein